MSGPYTSGAGVLETASSGSGGAAATATAVRLTLTAGATLSGHRVVKVDASGNAVYADNTTSGDGYKALGITTGAANIGLPVEVQTSGELEEPTWSWTPGDTIYLGVTGLLTAVLPTSPVTLLVVAKAITATKILVEVGEPLVLI